MPHFLPTLTVAVVSRGKSFIAYQGILRVEEIASGAEILQNKFSADNGPKLALSPDGKTLAIVCGPNVRKFFLWNWQAGAEPQEIKTVAAEGHHSGKGSAVYIGNSCLRQFNARAQSPNDEHVNCIDARPGPALAGCGSSEPVRRAAARA